ncbi:MAG: tetratricopeptide repeat protein [Alphaproteobacteria bacterium]|nr:tetratricopeptide repeat protein [Alphaproteobacteria bacterium]
MAGTAAAAAETRRLLDEAVARHRAGELSAAEMLYRAVLQREPRNAGALSLLGVIHFQAGDRDVGLEHGRRAAALAPRSPGILNNLGNMLVELGERAEAERYYRRAVQADAKFGDGWVNLGRLLHDAGKRREAASCLGRALAIQPAYAGAQEQMAEYALEEGELERARLHARAVAEFDPNRGNRALALKVAQRLMERERYEEAAETLLEPVRRLHSPGADLRGQDVEDVIGTTTATKLQHDIEQMRHLRGRGLIPEAYERAIGNYQSVLDGLLAPSGGDHRHRLSAAERTRLGPGYNRLLYLPRFSALPGGALNPALDFIEIERRLRVEPQWPVVIDDFLSAPALAALQRFCLEATIWWQFTFARELGASIRNGLATPPLLQVAQEARLRMPEVFGPHQPRIIWAYKYYENSSGLAAHVDDGAVSINLWITPDAANRDPSCGGLRFWNAAAPPGYFALTDQAAKIAMLNEVLASRRPEMREIPYRCNRALLFRSNLLHQTDRMDFANGYENRRINITFLFGERREGGEGEA